MRLLILLPLLLASATLGQTRPVTRSATSQPATATRPAASLPRTFDRALGMHLNIDANAMPCIKFTNLLADLTQTNLVINWNALAPAGITRDTPITLHLKDLEYEQVIRTFIEVLPTTGTRANYVVDENTLEITTNRELGKISAARIYDLTNTLTYSFNAPPTRAEMDKNVPLIEAVIRAELVRAGEPLDIQGHALVIKEDKLAATVSARGQEIVNHTLNMLLQPIKVGLLAPGTQLTTLSKRAQEEYQLFLSKPEVAVPDPEMWVRLAPEILARNPRKYPQFNLALLPGTKEALAKDQPDIGLAINNGGVLLLGPRATLDSRTVLAIYDLREVIKKLAAKSKITPVPGPEDIQTAIVQILQTSITPEGGPWGQVQDLGKKPAVMAPYGGVLIVFATAQTHRLITGALKDMNK